MDKRANLSVPTGVVIREMATGARLQISFMRAGQQCRELLPACAINKSSILYATNLRTEVRRKIADGSFDYASYFSDSARAKQPERDTALMEVLLEKQYSLYERQVASGKWQVASGQIESRCH